MARAARLGFGDVVPVALLLCAVAGSLQTEDDQQLNKAILEMLHIDKVSVNHRAKAHPYMTRVYQHMEERDFERSDGTLVQSFRSVVGPDHGPPGWIWFNVSSSSPAMSGGELVLFRKTIHPSPLSVTVTLHGVTAARQRPLQESPALGERQLNLDQRASSGYDVFDVSAVLAVKPPEVLGFQLRYTDEIGSLVLHEALTRSLYCLNRGSVGEPLLVLYQAHPRLTAPGSSVTGKQ